MAEPLADGAVQETATAALPRVTRTAVGAPGTVAGMTLLEALEARPIPTPLVASR